MSTTLASAFQSSTDLQTTPFTDEACETIIVYLEERKVVRRKTQRSFFALLAAILQLFNMPSLVCLGALCGCSQSGGKSGPAETGLTGPAAKALYHTCV